jgi:hypothetical protein
LKRETGKVEGGFSRSLQGRQEKFFRVYNQIGFVFLAGKVNEIMIQGRAFFCPPRTLGETISVSDLSLSCRRDVKEV